MIKKTGACPSFLLRLFSTVKRCIFFVAVMIVPRNKGGKQNEI